MTGSLDSSSAGPQGGPVVTSQLSISYRYLVLRGMLPILAEGAFEIIEVMTSAASCVDQGDIPSLAQSPPLPCVVGTAR